jgi:hypothetical protein
VAQVVQRRAPVKAVFNLGMYATALAPAIGLYHLVAGDASLLSARGMTAMAVGVATFALVNLLLISQLLAVLEERPVWDLVRESSKLSILIFLGNIARELTRAMGGEIEAISAPRRGSNLTVRPPMARPAEGVEDSSASRDRADDTQPSGPRARRAPDPLCRCS